MRRPPPPPRDGPQRRRLRRDLPRPEGPFDRLLRRRPERDPAPIIIGGTIAFLAVVIVFVFIISALLGGGGGGDGGGSGRSDTGTEIAPGIVARTAATPGLPPGLESLSEYVELEAEDPETSAIIGIPLHQQVDDPAGVGFYTYFEGRWQRLADAKLFQENRAAEGDFARVPQNLAVLRVVAQTYQVAGTLPGGGTLHPDAIVNIISPRDYAPAADGSVQGQATQVSPGEGILLIPTIVASGEDTAAVVNDILADESLREQHIEAILQLAVGTELDGIDLEYSSVDEDLGPEFTEFVSSLADGLHSADKALGLTLPPPTNQRQAYEWKKLGEKANIIKILPIADPTTYWETMPAALSQVVQDVDPRKVMLVVSPFSVEIADTARPIGYLQAMVQAAEAVVREPQNFDDIKPGNSVKLVARNLDPEEGASPLGWDTDAAAISYASGGTERRRIFIENGFSVAFKLELVQAYGLGGFSVSDASAQSDVANIWPTVNELINSATVSLLKPNEATLVPSWQAPDGGDIGAASGTTATWIPGKDGPHNLVLVVSDGQKRFGRNLVVEVKKRNDPSPTPIVTFAPDTPVPTPTPLTSGTPAPLALPVEVGLVADGDDADKLYTNDEKVSPGSKVIFLVTFDNDSDKTVTVASLKDSGVDVTCPTDGGAPNVVGISLSPDNGDGPNRVDTQGDDWVQCRFEITAPSQSDQSRGVTVTGAIAGEGGAFGQDSDGASFTTQ